MSALKLRVEKKLYIHDLLQCEERVIMAELNTILNKLFQVGGTKESFIKEYRALENKNVPIFQFEMDDVALGNLYDSFHISQGNETTEQDVSALANFDGDNTSISEQDVLTLQINMLQKQLDENEPVSFVNNLDSDNFSVVNETETHTSTPSYEDTLSSLHLLKDLKILQAQVAKDSIRDEIVNLLPDDKKAAYKETQKQLKKAEEHLKNTQKKLREAENERRSIENQIARKERELCIADNEDKENISKEIEKLSGKYDLCDKTIESLATEINRDEISISKNEEKLSTIIKEAKESDNKIKNEIEQKENQIKAIDEQLAEELNDIDTKIQQTEDTMLAETIVIDQAFNQYVESSADSATGDAKMALARATSEIGVKEATGNNDGAEIAKYRGGSDNKQPWCASFVSWAYKGNDVFGYDASVSGIRDKAKAKGLYSEKGDYVPKAGDVMIQKNGRSHTGIVEKVDADGTIHTIEGNASNRVRRVTYRPGSAGYNSISGWVRMSDTKATAQA